jgi:bifunctional non-homologous end joining protein LigD
VVASAARRDTRAGRVLIDWAQNNERRSMVAPYSLRASKLPQVSTPVDWEEVEDPARPLRFSPEQVLSRIEQTGDLFSPVLELVQRLSP